MRALRLDANPTKCVDRACLPLCPTRSVFVLICPPGQGACTNSTRRTSIKPRGALPGRWRLVGRSGRLELLEPAPPVSGNLTGRERGVSEAGQDFW
jgi:hypothetical protein